MDGGPHEQWTLADGCLSLDAMHALQKGHFLKRIEIVTSWDRPDRGGTHSVFN
jgi:hypothetical protein